MLVYGDLIYNTLIFICFGLLHYLIDTNILGRFMHISQYHRSGNTTQKERLKRIKLLNVQTGKMPGYIYTLYWGFHVRRLYCPHNGRPQPSYHTHTTMSTIMGGILLYAFIPQIVSFFSLETSRENLYQWPRDNDKPFSVQKLNGTIN